MAYTKKTWVDQDVERPKTYEVTNNQDGSITLTDSFGLVQELGTPVNAVNMNHIEDGIDGCAIRKHNLTETFNLGEWVLGGTGDDEGIYKSLVANNVGNALTDMVAWEKVELGGSGGQNVGEIIQSSLPLTDAGLHLLDGARLSGDGIYGEFVQYIADLYAENPNANYFTDETTWQNSVTTYGVCGKFVYDSTNNTVRLPKVTGIIEGTTDISALGDLIEAGLPNITGTAIFGADIGNTSGSLYISQYNVKNENGSGANNGDKLAIDASRSSSIYGNSTTVQPQTIKVLYYIVIANSTKTKIQSDIDEIATDLNGKADVDLTNTTPAISFATAMNNAGIRTVVETYINGTSWYRVYSDGWCEQGGLCPTNGDSSRTNTLLKRYRDANYTINITENSTTATANNATCGPVWILSKTDASFTIFDDAWGGGCFWEAKGYLAIGEV